MIHSDSGACCWYEHPKSDGKPRGQCIWCDKCKEWIRPEDIEQNCLADKETMDATSVHEGELNLGTPSRGVVAVTSTEKRVYELMQKPWHFVLVQEENGTWFVQVRELQGCMSEGKTWTDVYKMIHDAMRGWFRVGLEYGDTIPEPDED